MATMLHYDPPNEREMKKINKHIRKDMADFLKRSGPKIKILYMQMKGMTGNDLLIVENLARRLKMIKNRARYE